MWSMCFLLSLGSIGPEQFVNITSIVPPEATGEEASCVPYPSLTWFLTYHHRLNPCLQQIYSGVGLSIIYFPSLRGEKRLNRIQERRVWRHKFIDVKPEQLGGNWHCPTLSQWEWDSHAALDPAALEPALLPQ